MTDIPFTTEGGASAVLRYQDVFIRLSDATLWLHDSSKYSDSSLTPLRTVQSTGLTNGTTNLATAITAVTNVEPA